MSTENLIELVEIHPSIWNKSCEQYKDRYEKEKAWIEIARRIFQDWDTLGKKERNKKCKLKVPNNYKVDALKKKWKNIKDSLRKYLDTRSGDAAKKKKYVHLEALSFLC
ncbi:unnamed protein product [Acanthoscelides obtectus]|uniref:MADF domain-containing protein n=1 Tax=Acanthoscelides obtectus TaxID=200917 RepID=A0A9P0KE05_ACAOB|nr:unnamed protein product [Acanthoscelides obtectus]CAK1683190.1 hypothetical protein AOBTE_LOCUS34124 [Acanthoscelides obtectus]